MFDGKEYVYAVYEEKSFSKAAQKLYITQPALSTAIKKVEKKLGSPIFDRSTSPIGLTPSGEVKVITHCQVEAYASQLPAFSYLQFQRIGYFNIDPSTTPGHLVFNKTVGLRDTAKRK